MRRMSWVFISLMLIALLVAGCGANDVIKSGEESIGQGSDAKTGDVVKGNTDENSNEEKSLDGGDNDVSVSHSVDFIIEEPAEDQLVKSGKELVIKGKARLQKFCIEIEDGHNILGEASVELQQKPQELSEFQVSVMLDEHTSPSGMIIFVTQDENGRRQEDLILPIKFE